MRIQHLYKTKNLIKRTWPCGNVSIRGFATSHTLNDSIDKTEVLVGDKPAIPLDMDISQVALETGSNTGLAFIGNNIMGAFNWIKGYLPFQGDAQLMWNDTVIPHLTHLYIPSIYEFIQLHSGISWFIIIGTGTVALRIILLPLSKRSMRLGYILRDVRPKMAANNAMIKLLKEQGDGERAKKLEKLQQNYMAGVKGGSTMLSFVVCGMMMMMINRGLRHLAHLTPLLDGGIGPFLDMTVNSHSGVCFYILPLTMVSALGTVFHMNARKEAWYNPRLAVVAVPVAGVFVFGVSYMPVAMTLHYAISSWCTAGLHAVQQTNHELLGLPPPSRKLEPQPEVVLTRQIAKTQHLVETQPEEEVEAVHFVKPEEEDPKQPSEQSLLEEFIPPAPQPLYSQELPYTPVIRLGPHYAKATAAPATEEPEKVFGEENVQKPPPSSGGMGNTIAKSFRFNFKKRLKAWWFRQQLMRQGKKGNMKSFLEEAPPIPQFVQDPVELTTEVTPGLKKYVLRRQYPMNTLEEMERKVSYIERVQNQRW